MHVLSKIFLFLGFGLMAMCLPVLGQEADDEAEKLPEGAEKVLEKMKQFEAETMLEAQVKIEKKRFEVVRYLEKLMDEEARSGNLDGGLAIRNEIKRLKALPSAQPVKEKVAGKSIAKVEGDEVEKEKGDSEEHPIVGRWAFEDKDGSALVREFTADGKCVQYREGKKEWTLNYEVVSQREVDVVFLGALKFRHSLRGNDTLKTKEPEAVAEREKKEEVAAEE